MFNVLRKLTESTQEARAPSVSAEPIEGNALFEAMICEFHWTALQIGAVTACMNAGLSLQRSWMLRSCANLIPIQPPLITVALRGWKEIGLARPLAAKIGQIYFDLADAKKASATLFGSAGQFNNPATAVAKLEQITAVWRKLCDDCNEAVQQLEPDTRWRLSGLYTGNTLTLAKFLRDASGGGFGCVNVIGEVTLPVLPQRRRTQRFALSQPCKIVVQHHTFVGVTKEVSKTGLSLECEHQLSLRNLVTVELRNGRKLKGVVVWIKDQKLGIQFDNPLEENDALIMSH